MQNTPPVADYVAALTHLDHCISDEHRLLFQLHYQAPDRTATATQLATWAGVAGGYGVVNVRYGKMGHAVCDHLGIKPELPPDSTHGWWSLWSRGWTTSSGFVWQMLPQVAAALEELGWVGPVEFAAPEEVAAASPIVEGSVCRVTVNAYERNLNARRLCIAAHGTNCCICGFSFESSYGPDAEGYIHVHHVRPLSEIRGMYVVNPVDDLRPVCPNCHAMIHMGGRCRTIEEARCLWERHRP